jgi:hypothetical protein
MKSFSHPVSARLNCETRIISAIFLSTLFIIADANSQYVQQSHREPVAGEIPVTGPGSYREPGKTYILVNDISDPMSVIFLGKDVTLDLNGYTITYADGGYGHIPDFSFEEGLKDWDLSSAPGARTEDRKVQVMIGERVLRLPAGNEIVSAFVTLPVSGRSWFAMCGVAAQEMKIAIIVEDNTGKVVMRGDSLSPRLGGGIPYVHLRDIPAGKYRLRIKAITDCIIDYADIRPALDAGIGIVKEIDPGVDYEYLYRSVHGAFFDYAADKGGRVPVETIPVVIGHGTVTIKNGIIRNGAEGILSRGIQSNSDEIDMILENLKIVTSGINATAVDAAQAVITGCTFDITNPFIINRHGSDNYGVDLWGEKSSEVSFSEFYGGQGCLVFKGDFSKIHHNLFVNRQTVTNHYSIMAMGDSSLIFSNRIFPETGSGIEIYIHRGMEIFNNQIHVEAAPPTCEYGHSDYSTTAVRIADYNAVSGTSRAAFGNRIYNNQIRVTGKDYADFPDYVPMAWAVFYSASGGDNYIFGNEILVEDLTPLQKNETSAFYIGGGSSGGIFSSNTITTNVPAFWVAGRYGSASDLIVSGNHIIRDTRAGSDFSHIRMGWFNNEAGNIEFRSNLTEGELLSIDATERDHTWSVYWTLTIRVNGRDGSPIKDAGIKIFEANGTQVFIGNTNSSGKLTTELMEYSARGSERNYHSPYRVISGSEEKIIELDSNKEVVMVKRKQGR